MGRIELTQLTRTVDGPLCGDYVALLVPIEKLLKRIKYCSASKTSYFIFHISFFLRCMLRVRVLNR